VDLVRYCYSDFYPKIAGDNIEDFYFFGADIDATLNILGCGISYGITQTVTGVPSPVMVMWNPLGNIQWTK